MGKSGWKEKWQGWGKPSSVDGHKLRGVGLGISTHISGLAFFGFNGITIKVNPDGTMALTTGIGRMGQGGDTTQAMVAAEVLGVELEDINVIDGDTEVCGHTMVTLGSNGMHMVARATKAAAEDAKEQLLVFAAEHLEANVADLEMKDRRIFVKGSPDRAVTLKDLMSAPIYRYLAPPEVIGRAAWRSPPTCRPASTGSRRITTAQRGGGRSMLAETIPTALRLPGRVDTAVNAPPAAVLSSAPSKSASPGA